jgi:hypothetical protein
LPPIIYDFLQPPSLTFEGELRPELRRLTHWDKSLQQHRSNSARDSSSDEAIVFAVAPDPKPENAIRDVDAKSTMM